MFTDLINQLPTTATHPLALIGYIFLLGLFGMLAHQRANLRHLEQMTIMLPESDRIALVSNTWLVKLLPRKGLSAPEYISLARFRMKVACVALVLMLMFILSVLTLLTFKPKDGELEIDIMPPGQAHPIKNSDSKHCLWAIFQCAYGQQSRPAIHQNGLFSVAHSADFDEGVLSIKPISLYLDRHERGLPLSAIDVLDRFAVQDPLIAVRMNNPTSGTISVGSAQVLLQEFSAFEQPVIVLADTSGTSAANPLKFFNVGGGAVLARIMRDG